MFDDDAGWIAVPGVVAADAARALVEACDDLIGALADPDDPTVGVPGDRPVGGTLHLAEVDRRIEAIRSIMEHPGIAAAVDHLLGEPGIVGDVAYRNPQPGHGGQQLHADAVPQPTADAATTTVTAIVALVEFTPHNGATRIVPGSHRRPDLQRRAGSLPAHPDELLLTGPAGTAFVFSGHLLHSGTVNRSGAPRPALQMTWRRRGAAVSAVSDR